MGLTDRAIKALKPSDKRRSVQEDCLRLVVEPTGKKTFYYVYRAGKKKQQIKIGPYPSISLYEARRVAADYNILRERGEDPKAENLKSMTVKDLGEKFLKKYVASENVESTYKTRLSEFKLDIYPGMGHIQVKDVTRHDVIRCLKRHEEAKTKTGYNHTLGTIKKMFNWAYEQGIVEGNPAHMLKAKKTIKRNRVLTDDEIKTVLSLGDSDSEKILKFILYTGCRQIEVMSLTKERIDRHHYATVIQRKGGVTTEKRVYLPRKARSLITADNGLCFPGMQTQNGLAKFCLRRKFGFHARDIRRTVSTNLRILGFSQDDVSALLGHSKGVLVDTYQIYEHDKEKKEMLIAWQKKLREIMK